MSRVPWSRFARCCVCLAMVDIRPSMGGDGRCSTIDWSRAKFQVCLSNDDSRATHSSRQVEGQIAGSGRIVGNQEVTSFLGYFRVGGDSGGTAPLTAAAL